MKIQIIGDEIYADGYLVGLVVTENSGTPATALDGFRHWVDGANIVMPTVHDEKLDSADKVFARIEAKARGGYVKVDDIRTSMGVTRDSTSKA